MIDYFVKNHRERVVITAYCPQIFHGEEIKWVELPAQQFSLLNTESLAKKLEKRKIEFDLSTLPKAIIQEQYHLGTFLDMFDVRSEKNVIIYNPQTMSSTVESNSFIKGLTRFARILESYDTSWRSVDKDWIKAKLSLIVNKIPFEEWGVLLTSFDSIKGGEENSTQEFAIAPAKKFWANQIIAFHNKKDE